MSLPLKSEWIARQSSRPHGWLGAIVARVMSFETIRANRVALEQLEVGAGGSVLEIGCGHGRTLAAIEAGSRASFVAEIDPSEIMVALASLRPRRTIARGRAGVRDVETRVHPLGGIPFACARAEVPSAADQELSGGGAARENPHRFQSR